MSDHRYDGYSIASMGAAHIGSPQFGETYANTGVTAAEFAERLRAAMQHFDAAEFEAQIALHRPELWKRMNRRPSRWSGLRRRATRR